MEKPKFKIVNRGEYLVDIFMDGKRLSHIKSFSYTLDDYQRQVLTLSFYGDVRFKTED